MTKKKFLYPLSLTCEKENSPKKRKKNHSAPCMKKKNSPGKINLTHEEKKFTNKKESSPETTKT